jgi:hypothetical protein
MPIKIMSFYNIQWPKPKLLTPPNPGKEVEQQEFLLIPGGNAKSHGHFEEKFGSFL